MERPCTTVASPVRILIGINATNTSEAALKWYLRHLYLSTHLITLLHVSEDEFYPTFGYRAGLPKEEQFKVFSEKDRLIKAIQKKHQVILEDAGVEEDGSPGSTITNMAEKSKTNAIVVGRKVRRESPLRRIILGSVSEYVLHHSPVNVVVCTVED